MPTNEWNAATSSGIAVIGTRRAITAPVLPPIARPTTTSAQAPTPAGGGEASAVRRAVAIPIMPKRVARRVGPARMRPPRRGGKEREKGGEEIKKGKEIRGHGLAPPPAASRAASRVAATCGDTPSHEAERNPLRRHGWFLTSFSSGTCRACVASPGTRRRY